MFNQRVYMRNFLGTLKQKALHKLTQFPDLPMTREQVRAAEPGRGQVHQVAGAQGLGDEAVLEVLAQKAGRPASKNELSEHGLGRPLARFDRSIDVHISSLRHKMGPMPDGRSCIQTVYRQGYQLIVG